MYDVIIIGSGPSGSTAAKYLAKKDLKVLVIEKKKEIGLPIQCAGFIPSSEELKKMIPTLKIPDELKNIHEECILSKINSQRIYFSDDNYRRFNVNGFIVNREYFDKYLTQSACNYGAELLTCTKALSVDSNSIITDGIFGRKRYYGKVIIGADGPNSIVRQYIKNKLINNYKYNIKNNYYTCFQYKMKNINNITENEINIFFSNKLLPNGYFWIFPESKNSVSVGLGVKLDNSFKRKSTKYYLDNFIKKNSIAFKILKDGEITSIHTGFVPLYNLERSVYDNKLLIGDAASHIMATSGGGIPYAIVDGNIAADVVFNSLVSNGSIEDYEKQWKEQYGTYLYNSIYLKSIFEYILKKDYLRWILNYIPKKDLKNVQCGIFPSILGFLFRK